MPDYQVIKMQIIPCMYNWLMNDNTDLLQDGIMRYLLGYRSCSSSLYFILHTLSVTRLTGKLTVRQEPTSAVLSRIIA